MYIGSQGIVQGTFETYSGTDRRQFAATPKAVRDMVHLLNEDIQMRAERRAPDLDEAKARIRELYLFERIDVDSRDEHAVAIWRTSSDDGANRSDAVSSWLRR